MAVVTPVETTPVPAATDEGGIKDRLVRMFNELVHVRVITVVGDAKVSLPTAGGGKAIVDTDEKPLDQALVTVFNLIDGDVTNIVAPSLKDDQAIRAFHSAQVEKSMAVLPANVATLVDFGKELIDLLRS
jgi:hypothetical protein